MEITQFTYFQQVGGVELQARLRRAHVRARAHRMYMQNVENVYDLEWVKGVKYRRVFHPNEVEQSHYNFEVADTADALPGLRRVREGVQAAHRARTAAARLRLRAQVLAHVQPARRARRHLASRSAPASSSACATIARRCAEGYLADRASGWASRCSPRRTRRWPSAMRAASLLLEIGMEECPARFVGPALADLGRIAVEQLEAHRLAHGSIRTYGTPRRLSVLVEGVVERQEDIAEEVKGPPARVAFDESGAPTRAAQGFAANQGVSVEELVVKETEGGSYVVAVRREPGKTRS